MRFQLDRTPAHFLGEVQEKLDLIFPDHEKDLFRGCEVTTANMNGFLSLGAIKSSEVYRIAATTEENIKLKQMKISRKVSS